ncbi:divalent-cation tolerance protein CutA [Candidatus Magnetaquicoccus inordinatus]|uniref:divalent-cation tolerance protein CutA n=1 Tax=Candidatus Magnetaquicoccus inordinatus TaxID=2496818 RepID=UPI00187D5A5A|nr:divalent-cation tolerance protein CutA [Candidatus Magnetaquicoccus inordinatus]
MTTEMLLVWSTVADQETGLRLGRQLVEEQLVACVHLLPAGRSIYRWQGVVQEEQEWTLLIKTRSSLYPRLEERLRELHPYEVPEIVATAVVQAQADYLAWLTEMVVEPKETGSA